MTRSRATLAVLVLISAIAIATFAISLTNALSTSNWSGPLSTGICMLLVLALLAAHLLGWRWSAEAAVLVLTVLTVAISPANYVRGTVVISVLLPAVVAAVVLSPRWTVGTFVAVMLGIAAKVVASLDGTQQLSQALGPTYAPVNLTLLSGVVGGVALTGAVARHAQRVAETNALRAREESERAAQRTAELSQANELAQTQIAQQQQLLELVASLETPVTPLADGVLLAPIVGHIDSRRAQSLTGRLLEVVNEQRARTVILDISGVSVIDTGVARALLGTVQAIRLLGSEVLLTGISAHVAMTLTQLGITMEGVQTVRTPQEALMLLRSRPKLPAASVGAEPQPAASAARQPRQS